MIFGYKALAICVAEMNNEDILDMINPLYQYMEKSGWKTLIFNSTTDLQMDTEYDRGEKCIYKLIPYDKMDAILIYGRTIKQNSVIQEIIDNGVSNNVPVFVIDCDVAFEGAYNLVYEEEYAFKELVTHVVEYHGLKRINFIAGMKDNIVSDRRIAIFKEILEKNNIPFDDERQLGYGCFYDYPTIKVMQKFMEDPDGLPEAIVCANDTMALAVCDFLADNGIKVPGDIVVTGFDGIVREKYSSPRLTTCRRNMYDMAEFVGNKIQESVGHVGSSEFIQYPLVFSRSESCGCTKRILGNNRHKLSRLYSNNVNSMNYDRSMVHFLTKMNMCSSATDMQDIMKYYIRFDSYICANKEMDSNEKSYHWYNFNPFSNELISYKYFDEEELSASRIKLGELVPDFEENIKKDGPIVFSAIHDQADCMGYMATFFTDGNYDDFLQNSYKISRLTSTINNIVSLHVQQNSLRFTNKKLHEMQDKIIAGFADLVESRDDSTGQHVKRTQELISILVENASEHEKYMHVLTPEIKDLIIKAAPLHDIGKIAVSDIILNKPGKLTPEEFKTMQRHCEEGGKIIDSTLTGIEDDEYISIAKQVAVYHHEKWNGAGYPYGLAGEEIPLAARLMAIVDVFDALSSKRVYKEAYSLEESFKIIEESRGSHFDPYLVDIFFEAKDEIVDCFSKNIKSSAFESRKLL